MTALVKAQGGLTAAVRDLHHIDARTIHAHRLVALSWVLEGKFLKGVEAVVVEVLP
jgi:hypothetical protein